MPVYSDYTYEVIGEEAWIIQYTGTDSVVDMPEYMIDSIGGVEKQYPVVGIRERVFLGVGLIEEITVSKAVRVIERYNFSLCPKLKKITLPTALESLIHCIWILQELTELVIPDNVKIIEGSIWDCLKLEKITLPTAIESLIDCIQVIEELTELVIPDNVKVIEGSIAFCNKLKQIKLPKNLHEIRERSQYRFVAFSDLPSLTDLFLPDNVEIIDVLGFEGDIFVKGGTLTEQTLKDVEKSYYTYEIELSQDKILLVIDGQEVESAELAFQEITSASDGRLPAYPELDIYSLDRDVAKVINVTDGKIEIAPVRDGITEVVVSRFVYETRCQIEVVTRITEIRLPQKKITLDLTHHRKKLIYPVVVPKEAAKYSIKWSSSDLKVATVEDGVVTSVGRGKAVIRCESKVNPQVYDECKVTVVNMAPITVMAKAKKEIIIMPSDPVIDLKIGKTVQLCVRYKENQGQLPSVKWSSKNETIATVSQAGLVTGRGRGTTEIVATVYGIVVKKVVQVN